MNLSSVIIRIKNFTLLTFFKIINLYDWICKNKVKASLIIFSVIAFQIFFFFFMIREVTFRLDSGLNNSYEKMNKNELSGYEYPLVSLAKACSYDGGCAETVILFSSKINSVSAKEFEQFVAKNPTIRKACFRSSGGEIKELKTITKTIRDTPLTTCMADYYRRIAEPGGKDDNAIISGGTCASACNTALLSSSTRLQIGKETFFKGHATGVTNKAKISFRLQEEMYLLGHSKNVDSSELKELVRAAKTPDVEYHLRYIKTVENINHVEEMKTLNRSELLEFRIFTHQCDGLGNCNPIVTQPAKEA